MTCTTERHEEARWNLATRIGFRFVFSYFLLPSLLDYGLRLIGLADEYYEMWDDLVYWVAEDILHIQGKVAVLNEGPGLGIGNTVQGWVAFLYYLVLAAVATVIWSVLDRQRLQYGRLHAWLRLLLRLRLASAMIIYGAIKTIPSQMIAPPPLGVLQQRIADIFPNHLLWWTVGASPPFESFSGLAELVGGLLLLLPWTTLLGALVCAADMLFVFMLNMCYDVPVKLYSLQLLAMALFLLAPDLRRLADVFLFNRRVEPARVPPLFARKWLDRVPHVLLLLFCLYSVPGHFKRSAERYRQWHPPRPPLFGLWSVDEFAMDGKEVPKLTDPDRWRWVQVAKPGGLSVERMNGSFELYALDLDPERKTLKLKAQDKPRAELVFRQPDPDVLILEGRLDGRPIRAKLRQSPVLAKRLHWTVRTSVTK